MEHYAKFLKGIALVALASVLMYGAALAVPSPTYPSFHSGSDAALTSATPAAAHPASGARILFRTSDRLLASGGFRSGGGSLAGNAVSISTGNSHSKTRYMLSGMVLAALTPLALHRAGEPGSKSAVQTQTPGSSSLANLGDAISTGHGHGRGGDKGNSGNGDGDGEDCDNGDNGDVCDSGDTGSGGDCGDCTDNGGGDCGDCTDNGGDCDNGGGGDCGDCGGGDQGGGGGGGGDHGGGGGGTSLPEPGTIPLVGAGLMMAIAFRSRRAR